MTCTSNLARSELSAAEESACIQRRKEIWDEINGRTFPTIQRERGRPQQFASEIAEITGSSKRDVNLKIARARELGADIHRVVGTSLDKGVGEISLVKETSDLNVWRLGGDWSLVYGKAPIT